MEVLAQTLCVGSTSFPPSLLSYIIDEASHDADAVGCFLGEVEQRSGLKWERPVTFPAAFLVGTAAALRAARWEVMGDLPHIAAELPSSQQMLRMVSEWCLTATTSERDRRVMQMALSVFQLSVSQFAWEGKTMLGAAVLLQGQDEDSLISAMAEIAWKLRHSGAE